MPTLINKGDKVIVLRNPAEKAKRYAHQLKAGKVTETGELLTNTQKAFRGGYLKARKDNAKAFKSNQRKKHKEQNNYAY